MPNRRINFTGRQRILNADLVITVNGESGGPISFSISKLELDRYDLPANAKVFVEAYKRMSYMRFDCGSVGALSISDALRLSDFRSPEGIKFRIKITDVEQQRGQLLAELSGIVDLRRESLLPVEPSNELGQEVYRLDFSDEELTLLINKDCGDWRNVVTEPIFVSLVYPNVVRMILTKLVHSESRPGMEEEGSWMAQWQRLGSQLAGDTIPAEDDIEICELWVELAVGEFCKRHEVFASFIRFKENGDLK